MRRGAVACLFRRGKTNKDDSTTESHARHRCASQADLRNAFRTATCLAGGLLLLPGLSGCKNRPDPRDWKEPAGAGTTQVVTSTTVTLKTSDGWTIIGDLYTPKVKPYGAVVLLHQRGGSATDWKPLCEALQNNGIVALAIDQRGAGRSLKGPGPTGKDAPWITSPDIAAAVDTLIPKYTGHIGLVGASYGADNALIFGVDNPVEIQSVALYSPGFYEHGLDVLKAAGKWSKPIVIYHGHDDLIAGNGPRQIINACPSTDQLIMVYPENKHGTGLLSDDKVDHTLGFFERTLKAPTP